MINTETSSTEIMTLHWYIQSMNNYRANTSFACSDTQGWAHIEIHLEPGLAQNF